METKSSENKLLVKWLIEELFNSRRTEIVRFLYAPKCRGNTPLGAFESRDQFLTNFARFANAFPDFRMKINYLVADGDRVVAHYTFTVGNIGPWDGLSPKGLTLTGIVISQIANNRVVQQDFVWDTRTVERWLWNGRGRPVSPTVSLAA
jgi:predicted ester cyclase